MSGEFSGDGGELIDSGGSPEDQAELDFLFSVTYEELRRLASAVRQRDPAATLSPTTLVNEAWLKLSRTPAVSRTSALHFKRIAARAMRQVLVTAARRRNAYKRTALFVTVTDFPEATVYCDEQILALNDALEEMAAMNPRQAQLVESRFFGGLETGEIASLLAISEATVLRDWRAAKAWLARQLDTRRAGAVHEC